MLELLKRLAYGYWQLLNGSAQDAADSLDNRDWAYFLRSIGIILLLVAALIGCGILGFILIWRIRAFLLALAVPPLVLAILIASYYENRKPHAEGLSSSNDIDIELARQKGLEVQEIVMGFMYRVLTTIATFTPVIRPYNQRDIEACTRAGESFYMKDNIVVYQAEVETEGEITPEVEETIRREVQRYSLKYIVEYPNMTVRGTG